MLRLILLAFLLIGLASGQLLPLLSTCSGLPSNFAANTVIKAGFMFTPGKSLSYCATEPISGVCLKGVDVNVNVTGFITLPISCSPLKTSWTSLKIPFSAQYVISSGSSKACPSSSPSDPSTFQGNVTANVCAGGVMYLDPLFHPASASVSFDSNNNVDLLLFSFHLGSAAQANALINIPFCLPIPLLPAPAQCLLKNGIEVLLNGNCGTKCSCTSWELTRLSASISAPGGIALDINVCNYCSTPIDYLAVCLANLANLDLALGVFTASSGRQYNVSLDAGLSLLPLCRNLRFKSLSANGISNKQCDVITLQLGGWTPSFTLGVHAKLLGVGLGVESQLLNVFSCPEVQCKTPTLQLPYPALGNLTLTAGVDISATVSLQIPVTHPACTVASIRASVLLSLGCTGGIVSNAVYPWLLNLVPLKQLILADDTQWYPLDDSYVATATVPDICGLTGGSLYVKGSVVLSATVTVLPLDVQVNARVRLAVGSVLHPWSNITIAKAINVDCPIDPTTAPPTTLPPTTNPDPSATPAPTTLPPYVPPVFPPVTCPLPGFAPPTCTECSVPAPSLAYWCVPDGVGSYFWTALASDQQPPSGSLSIGSVAASGFSLDCSCKPIFKSCASPCSGDTCICSPKTGECVADKVCQNPPNNTDCDPCPMGSNGLECSGHGICNCSVCLCAEYDTSLTTSAGSIATYGGLTCEDVPKTSCDYNDCDTCQQDTACDWCSTEGGRCQAAGSCPDSMLLCSTDVPPSQEPPACTNSCGEHGECVNDTDTGLVQCVCDKGYHGPDCDSSGGLKNKAAIISGAVVAGIVLGSLAGAGVLAYGGKKGVDWMQASSDPQRQVVNNPAFQDSGKSVDNAAFDRV